jgi:hypothetical protein
VALVAAAVCPHPPLPVPELGGAQPAPLDELRTACRDAVGLLLEAGPDLLILIGVGVRTEESAPARCVELGTVLARRAGRVGMLVLGDGSARRSDSAPGYYDARAEPFDAGVVEAFASGDVAALTALDPVLAAELRCAGRAAWQVLAGASGDAVPSRRRVHYAAAPLGVGYVVASWT